MRFFETFWTWLQAQLAAYIGTNTALIASALAPAVVTLATIYVMLWAWLHLTGKIQEPVLEGAKRIVIIGGILGLAINLWLYNDVIVNTFFTAPAQLASVIAGAQNPVTTIDNIWDRGGTVAGMFWNKGGVLLGDFGYYLAAAVVWLLIGAVCVLSMFLIALSSIALAVLLALGPLFLALLFFDSTKRFFESWIAQLSNYALITILTILVAALMLRIVESYATQTAALGPTATIADALNMLLIAALVLLIMRQVMPIAAGLASGIALNSFNGVSTAVAWGLSGSRALGRTGYQVGRGVLDARRGEAPSRWDSLRRQVGNSAARRIGIGPPRPSLGGGTVERTRVVRSSVNR